MPQVVNSENHVQFVTTGSVPEFVAPTTPEAKPDAKPTESTAAQPKPDTNGAASTEAEVKAKADAAAKGEPARDETGKFVKADEVKTDGKKADDLDPDDAELPERVKRQIGKKHRQMKEAEEFARERDQAAERERIRADAAERELQRIRGAKSEGPKPGEDVDPDEPKQGDFKTVGEYTRALVKYEAEKAGKAGKAQAEQSRQQSEANAVIGEFVKRQEAFKAATPDYEEVIGDSDVIVPNIVTQYLMESEFGPQLAYHFAKNPDEVTRLKKLSPTRQIAEVGKLETKFEKKADAPVAAASRTEVSKAPAPISPLKGESVQVQKDPKDMTVQELREHRRKEAIAKAGR